MPPPAMDSRLRLLRALWRLPGIKTGVVVAVATILTLRLGVVARVAFALRVVRRFWQMSTVPTRLPKPPARRRITVGAAAITTAATTAHGAAASSEAGNSASCSGEGGTARDVLSIGVIGTANIAKYAVVLPCRRYAGAAVAAVASRSLARARKFAAAHGIPHALGSYEELLDNPNIDAVYISLPTHLHGEWARRAFSAGKHVLVEKPICQNYAEGKQMFDLVRDRRLALQHRVSTAAGHHDNGGGGRGSGSCSPATSSRSPGGRQPNVPTILEGEGEEADGILFGDGGGDDDGDDEMDFGGHEWVVEVEDDDGRGGDGGNGDDDVGEGTRDDDDFPFLEDQETLVPTAEHETGQGWMPPTTALLQPLPVQGTDLHTASLPVDALPFTPVVMEAMHYRYHPLMKRVRQLVRGGCLGHVVHIRANFSILKLGSLLRRWGLVRGAVNETAAEHHRMKMLDRWCYCVDVARFILPGYEFSVMEVPRMDRDGVRVLLEAARWTDKVDDVGPVAVELSSYSASLAHAPFSWELAVEGTQGALEVHNWGYPWLWNRINVTQYPSSTAAGGTRQRQTWTEEVQARGGGTTFDGQLRAFARRCRGAEARGAGVTNGSSEPSSEPSSGDDEGGGTTAAAARATREQHEADSWWRQNVGLSPAKAGATREDLAADSTAGGGGGVGKAARKGGAHSGGAGDGDDARGDADDAEFLDLAEVDGVDELEALASSALDTMALVESVLLRAGQKPISLAPGWH